MADSATVYRLDVETYVDSDGVGDSTWLIERLDHLAGLGVNCLSLDAELAANAGVHAASDSTVATSRRGDGIRFG